MNTFVLPACLPEEHLAIAHVLMVHSSPEFYLLLLFLWSLDYYPVCMCGELFAVVLSIEFLHFYYNHAHWFPKWSALCLCGLWTFVRLSCGLKEIKVCVWSGWLSVRYPKTECLLGFSSLLAVPVRLHAQFNRESWEEEVKVKGRLEVWPMIHFRHLCFFSSYR